MEDPWTVVGLALGGLGTILGIVFLALFARYFKLWIQAFSSRAKIGPFALVFMSLRKVKPSVIVDRKSVV